MFKFFADLLGLFKGRQLLESLIRAGRGGFKLTAPKRTRTGHHGKSRTLYWDQAAQCNREKNGRERRVPRLLRPRHRIVSDRMKPALATQVGIFSIGTRDYVRFSNGQIRRLAGSAITT